MKDWKNFFESIYENCNEENDNKFIENNFKNKINTGKELIIDNREEEEEEEEQIKTTDITIDEIKQNIICLKNNKAAGSDYQITHEVLKNSGESIIEELKIIFDDVLNNNKIPENWKNNIIIPIPKPNKDKSKMENPGEL